jgi:3-dehydrosphinganine reductase
MKIKDFQGKIVYIVGGSSGIGLAGAKILAAKGAHILIISRSKDKLESAVAEAQSAAQNKEQKIEYRQLDASQNAEVKQVMAEAVESFGVPHVLLNFAGKSRPNYFEKITFEQFDDIIKTNLYNIWNTISALIPYMKKEGGYIVNTSSSAVLFTLFGFTDYMASKAGIIAFSEVLRMEMKPEGVSVSVLLPSDTETPGLEAENLTKPYETKVQSEWGTVKSPEYVIQALLKGMRKERFLIIPNLMERIFYVVKRFFPGLVMAVLDGDIKKAQKKMREGKAE